MKKYAATFLVILASSVSSAFAHGVEKILPMDATNVKISAVSLDSMMTSQTLISDGNDGPVYQDNYSPSLSVEVTYNSADQSEDATALDNSNDPSEVVVGGPTAYFELQISDAQAAAIKAKTLNPASLVNINVSSESLQVNNPVYTSACRFDNDSAQPENADTCIQNVYTNESHPVLSVDLN